MKSLGLSISFIGVVLAVVAADECENVPTVDAKVNWYLILSKFFYLTSIFRAAVNFPKRKIQTPTWKLLKVCLMCPMKLWKNV